MKWYLLDAHRGKNSRRTETVRVDLMPANLSVRPISPRVSYQPTANFPTSYYPLWKRGGVATALLQAPSPWQGEGGDGGQDCAINGIAGSYSHPNPPPARERERGLLRHPQRGARGDFPFTAMRVTDYSPLWKRGGRGDFGFSIASNI